MRLTEGREEREGGEGGRAWAKVQVRPRALPGTGNTGMPLRSRKAFCFFRAIHPCNFVLQNGEKMRRKKRDRHSATSGRAGGRRQRTNESEMNSDGSFSFPLAEQNGTDVVCSAISHSSTVRRPRPLAMAMGSRSLLILRRLSKESSDAMLRVNTRKW